jgi:hypothetical protein
LPEDGDDFNAFEVEKEEASNWGKQPNLLFLEENKSRWRAKAGGI